jgi:hypothetical protein
MKTRKIRRERDLCQTRNSLFVTVARREAIMFPFFGMQRHAHIVERKAIVR